MVVRLPDSFEHVNLQLPNNVETQPFPNPTRLQAGIWITTENRDFRVAFAPGVIGSGGGLRLYRSTGRGPFFFPVQDASLLRVASVGNNGRIAIVAG